MLVVDAGRACAWYQGRVMVNLECKRIQVDEIWGFVGAKQKNAETKLVPCWLVGGRDSDYGIEFMDNLASRTGNSR